ncbi:hypothetical protein [Phreatobacter stygius]|nr:hypothetical protein [Phreatobacter stygius]
MPDFNAVATASRGVAGGYVAGGLGYGSAPPRAFSIIDGYACPGTTLPYIGPVTYGGGSGCATNVAMSGVTAHAILGWNLSGGEGWVSGIEARGRLGREGGTGRLGGTANVTMPGVPAYLNSASGAYKASLDGGLALSLRYGYAVSGFLPFVRIGLGAARLTEAVDFNATGAKICTIVPPGCTTGGTIASSKSSWLPSAVIGAGLEIPFGRFFARVDAEAEAVFAPSQNLTRTLVGQAIVTAGGAPTGQVLSTSGNATLRSENWIIARRLMVSGGFRF